MKNIDKKTRLRYRRTVTLALSCFNICIIGTAEFAFYIKIIQIDWSMY